MSFTEFLLSRARQGRFRRLLAFYSVLICLASFAISLTLVTGLTHSSFGVSGMLSSTSLPKADFGETALTNRANSDKKRGHVYEDHLDSFEIVDSDNSMSGETAHFARDGNGGKREVVEGKHDSRNRVEDHGDEMYYNAEDSRREWRSTPHSEEEREGEEEGMGTADRLLPYATEHEKQNHQNQPNSHFAIESSSSSSSSGPLHLHVHVSGLRQVNPFSGVDSRESAAVAALRRQHEIEANFTCPPYRYPKGKSADARSVREAIGKYDRYTREFCNTTGMLQLQMQFTTYTFILDKIAEIARIRRGDRLFDWGSGCGTMLNYYHMRFNSTGVGIDVTDVAVRHAVTHRQPGQLFCWLNGVDLRAFPSESFDAVVTWATLYHVRRTMQQCEIVNNLVRMLRNGGRAFIGHLRTDKTQEYWKKNKCSVPGATISRIRDWRVFRQKSWRKHDFFSLVIQKHVLNETTATGSFQLCPCVP